MKLLHILDGARDRLALPPAFLILRCRAFVLTMVSDATSQYTGAQLLAKMAAITGQQYGSEQSFSTRFIELADVIVPAGHDG